MFSRGLSATLLAAVALPVLISRSVSSTADLDGGPLEDCKCFPGDACWPNTQDWAKLNDTVNGRLIATVPLGTPCHDPAYDAVKCQELRDDWLYSTVHLQSSSSVMAPLFANQSCDPFRSRDSPCTLGNYVSYAVNVSTTDHIAATLKFAEEHNIRFVIRNTGHDYNGRSTGAGALAVWTHYLKETKVVDWEDKHYKGKALEIGAGVEGYEALAAAHTAGLVVVTGECPSVGLAGGYIQGGGHSALSTKFGLAADNALSYDIVTPQGKLITASRTQNSDLYWALSGGGGGNYGVVVSVVVQAHPDATVGGASFTIDISQNDQEKLYAVIDAFHAALPKMIDSGVMIIYFFSQGCLMVPAMTAYGKTKAETEEILKPFVQAVSALGVTLEPSITEYPNYYQHYNHYWGPLPGGNIQVGTMLFGGRLIPRSVLPTFSPTARKLVEEGVTFIGVGLDVSRFGGDDANAVLPQWRDSIVQSSLTLPWSFDAPFHDMMAAQEKITNEIQPIIEAATPGAGAYMNEADFQQRDFQSVFFGSNYNKLLKIKSKHDPKGLLYATAGVGSEEWIVHEDGRLCREKR
ncbi:FAD-linked oxidoreductase ZEB1 [Cladobotryum mycophilum]|uniref:FAD-linked oxidoreductase ZEB1 n=1 Tax=Cladobotryum mycophilum TaxID=491253 RepID=A0ABR0ST83_9HYPO